PYLMEQLIFGDNSILIACQVTKKLIFQRLQFDLLASYIHPAKHLVDFHFPELQSFSATAAPLVPFEYSLYFSEQYTKGIRLLDVIVTADIQRDQNIIITGTGANK